MSDCNAASMVQLQTLTECQIEWQVSDADFAANYDLLKSYVTHVVTPDRLPPLQDHKDP